MTISTTTKLIGAAALLSVSLAANAQSQGLGEPMLNKESVQVSDHHIFNTDTVVDGATVLIRDQASNQVNASIVSRALEPDTAYSIWWAVFNNPQFCIELNLLAVSSLFFLSANIPLRALAAQTMDAAVGWESVSNIHEDRKEAVAAFREKRKPNLTGE